jgi:hypothetical protein
MVPRQRTSKRVIVFLNVQSELAGRRNERRCFVQSLLCLPLNPLDQLITCRDIMNEANYLACGPNLYTGQSFIQKQNIGLLHNQDLH